MNVIGIDLGGTKIAAALFDKSGKILFREQLKVEKRSGDAVCEMISELIRGLLKKNSAKVTAAGVSVPGIYYAESGNVWAPNLDGWENYPLLKNLEKTFGPEEINIKIDSDRACYILGEKWKGAAQGCDNAVYLAIGTGIGAGLMVDGNVLRGHGDIAGAVGWMHLDSQYSESFKNCGQLEYFASGEGLVRMAKEIMLKNRVSDIDAENLTTRDLFQMLEDGHPLARSVFEKAVLFWGLTAASLVSFLNPQKIIFGGGVFGPAGKFLSAIREEAAKWAQPISFGQVELAVSALGPEAGLYGAGYLALKENQ